MRPGVGFFVEHPLGRVPETQIVTHTCPYCKRVIFEGPAFEVLEAFREHVYDQHIYSLKDGHLFEECGCCGSYHHVDFDGDCRENWERF